MTNPLTAIGHFFQKIWGALNPKLEKAAEIIDSVSHKALDVVALIDSIAPNPTVEAVTALYKKFALDNLDKWLALPEADRGAALANAAVKELAKDFPNATTSELKTAVELALQKYKSTKP